MASAPSSWKTLFKFLLEECFQKATLQMSWCTPSLAKPQICFSFFQISFSRAHSELKARSSEGYVALEPNCFLLEGRGENWSPVENEGPAAGWPPGQTLPRKSGWAAPPPSCGRKQSVPVCYYLHSWGGGLRRHWEHTAPPCPGRGGQGAWGGSPTACGNWDFCLHRSCLLTLPKLSVPIFVFSPPPPPEKNFFWSMRLCLFCILSHLMFTWQLPPPKPRFLSRCLLCAGARQKCLRTFLLPCPLNGCTDLEDTAEFTNEETKAGSG